MEYYSAIKKPQNNAICSNMDGPRDDHTEWSKSDRERQLPYDITYMWNLKYDMNLSTKQKQTHKENRLVVAKREDSWGGKDWEFEANRCKLLYVKWINSKILLYSTGNCIQSPEINHNGKEYKKKKKKECIYVNNRVPLL